MTDTTTEPRTAAGRALPGAFSRWMVSQGQPDFYFTLHDAILAIEAEATQQALARVAERVAEWRVEDCQDCGGYGWVAETTADPLSSGEPGEPYQVQRVCDHRAAVLAILRPDSEEMK